MTRNLVLVALVASFTATQAVALDVAGLWLTPDGASHVEIADCGDGTPCGSVSWIDPAATDATRDENNPDETLRSRPLIGLEILQGFERKDDRWRGGTIYDPEDGRSYGSRLKSKDDGTLEVKGCIGPICQTQIWTPVSEPAP